MSRKANRAAVRRYRIRHPERVAKTNLKLRAAHPTAQYLLAYRRDHPCLDCGEADAVVLEFDHARGVKQFNLALSCAKRHTLEEVIAEIEKCDIVCANCHRRRTEARRNYSVHRLLEQVFGSGA